MSNKQGAQPAQDAVAQNDFVISESAKTFTPAFPGGGVRLPFQTLLARFRNGNPQLEELGGVDAFGGWEFDADKYDDYVAKNKVAPLTYAERSIGRTQEGKKYERYTTRQLWIALCASRSLWEKDKKLLDHYEVDARRKVQAVVLIANETKSGNLEYFAPGFLVVQGLQGKHFFNAINEWADVSSGARKQLGTDVNPFLFYVKIGTFGKAPRYSEVGKGKKTNTITPIALDAPETIDRAYLQRVYVSDNGVNLLQTFLDLSQEWLNANKSSGGENPTNKPGQERFD